MTDPGIASVNLISHSARTESEEKLSEKQVACLLAELLIQAVKLGNWLGGADTSCLKH
jgi:hypothetical protein